jgi:hypothetical protein
MAKLHCKPIPRLRIEPGTAQPAGPAMLCAALTITARDQLEGKIHIRFADQIIDELGPGDQFSPQATGDNTINPAEYQIDAAKHTLRAEALIVAWVLEP